MGNTQSPVPIEPNLGAEAVKLQGAHDDFITGEIQKNLTKTEQIDYDLQILAEYLQTTLKRLKDQDTALAEPELAVIQAKHDKFRELFAKLNDVELCDERFPIPADFSDMTEETLDDAKTFCEYHIRRCQYQIPDLQQKLYQIIQLAYLIADIMRKTVERVTRSLEEIVRKTGR